MNTHGIIPIDGFELSYSIEGTGIPVLVIGSETYYPGLFSAELRQHLQLIFIGHRGFAKSPRPLSPEDYTLNRILEDMEHIRQTLLLEKFVILGHSGHAFLALEYAIRYPQHVQQVVLLNSAPTNSQERQQLSFAYFDEDASPERKQIFEAAIAHLAGDLQREPERRFAHVCIRMGAHTFHDPGFDGAYMWDGVYTNMPIIDHLWGEAFGQLNMLERLAVWGKPVFVGLGRSDYLVGPHTLWDSVEETHPHVTKVIFEHSGHYPMLEEPQAFDTELLQWLGHYYPALAE